MNRYIAALIAIVLIAMFVWKPSQLNAGLQHLAPAAPASPPPTTEQQEPVTDQQEPSPQEPTTPTPEGQRRDPAKCLDGSPLTVTSRDSNQTNYRCGSEAIGAYTN
jgi:hypothetical protein